MIERFPSIMDKDPNADKNNPSIRIIVLGQRLNLGIHEFIRDSSHSQSI